jgi:hypothetical protein
MAKLWLNNFGEIVLLHLTQSPPTAASNWSWLPHEQRYRTVVGVIGRVALGSMLLAVDHYVAG